MNIEQKHIVRDAVREWISSGINLPELRGGYLASVLYADFIKFSKVQGFREEISARKIAFKLEEMGWHRTHCREGSVWYPTLFVQQEPSAPNSPTTTTCMNTATLLSFLSTPHSEQQVAKKFFNSRVLPARQAIRALIWAGQIKVINGNQFQARAPLATPDISWMQFQAAYMNF